MSLNRRSVIASAAGLGAPWVHAEARPLRFAWWGGASRHQATLAALKLFEQRHGVRVKAEYMGFSGYLERLTTQIAG
ncbi:MAG: carbohydrate ABC transporter substrate-binding protein, partial [Rubrivivax sp.]